MKQYHDLLRHILANGEECHDRTGVGTTSIFGYQMRMDLRHGFPLLTTKKLPFRWIAEELFWMLSGSTDEKALRAKGVDIWKEWATAEQCDRFGRGEGDLGPIYGFQWRNFGARYYKIGDNRRERGVDQIYELLHDIEITPNSRRLIVTGWNPAQAKRVTLPPCHTLWQVKIHERQHSPLCMSHDGPCDCESQSELSLQLSARSIDAFLGLPFNIAFYALLTELLAFVTGRVARELIVSFGDLHIYSNHMEQVREQLDRPPKALPRVYIADPRRELNGFEGLMRARYEHLHLEGYQPWPKIDAPVAI